VGNSFVLTISNLKKLNYEPPLASLSIPLPLPTDAIAPPKTILLINTFFLFPLPHSRSSSPLLSFLRCISCRMCLPSSHFPIPGCMLDTAGVTGVNGRPADRLLIMLTDGRIGSAYIPFQAGAWCVRERRCSSSTSIFYFQLSVCLGADQAGKLRALAVGSRQRIEPMPNCATGRRVRLPRLEESLVRRRCAGPDPCTRRSRNLRLVRHCGDAREVKSKLVPRSLSGRRVRCDFASHPPQEHENRPHHRDAGIRE